MDEIPLLMLILIIVLLIIILFDNIAPFFVILLSGIVYYMMISKNRSEELTETNTCLEPQFTNQDDSENVCDKTLEYPTDGDDRYIYLTRERERCRRTMDGIITSANNYKKNFHDELDKAEAKRWWGEDDY